ncbi:hypothetical protein BT96DRAFT_1042765 [Gymnopus androsaceus JB14]|uniref:DUF6589 domain-containing protein n=1 Tax=Gymnopus androsaceus JB14 TaxID=1447944 RepID=A0A6A4HD45_9AGAR|nr:hypothetical protein BT96DRAFT_1042765 [Gymnopus androsaceus JB14]
MILDVASYCNRIGVHPCFLDIHGIGAVLRDDEVEVSESIHGMFNSTYNERDIGPVIPDIDRNIVLLLLWKPKLFKDVNVNTLGKSCRQCHKWGSIRKDGPQNTKLCVLLAKLGSPIGQADLPPLELSPGLVLSSPVVGTVEERQEKRLQKGQKKRAKTLAEKAAEKELEEHLEAERKLAHAQETFRGCLDYLHSRGFTFGNLCMYYFNPDSDAGAVRWHEFAAVHGRITQLLDWWIHAKSASVRSEVHEWAVSHVCAEIGKSARHITRLGLLKTHDELINKTFEASIIVRVFEAVTKSSDRSDSFGKARNARGQMVTTSAIAACLREHNLGNNLAQRMMGLYLYASGVQRQNFTVLSKLGICTSYTDMIRNEEVSVRQSATATASETDSADSKPKKRRLGLIRLLSNGLRVQARTVASVGLFGEVYDNINFMNRTAEQVIGKHDNQENGTCITIFKLWAARLKDIQASVLQAAFDSARPLHIKDIVHNEFEEYLFRECLIHSIIHIIIKFSRQEKLAALQKEVDQKQPQSSFCIQPHKTEIYPVNALNIDESSITGNAEADSAVVDRVRFIAGDQLSIARLRALENIRAGQETGYEGFAWGIWMPGLFHSKMADITGIFATHFENATARPSNPGSLAFHNTALNRIPIVPTSLPNFRTCRDLVFVSLYARSSLEEYAESEELSFEQIYVDAQKILDRYANSSVVEELRQARKDMVFENAALFLRDALISREFTDAVQAGDSGRVVLVLKIWALSFRGSGRTKYAYKMLHLIHNIEVVWPEEMKKIVLNNWLVNTTGGKKRFLELDLLQEHLNYWIKVFYKAHGSNMSWEWLSMITPCIDVLRSLARTMNSVLGSDQGNLHTETDLGNDIDTLMSSLTGWHVYKTIKGREVDEDNEIANDVVLVGLISLTTGTENPLTEYEAAFTKLQRRRRMAPVDIDDTEPPIPPSRSPSPSTDSSSSACSDSRAASPEPADISPISPSLLFWPIPEEIEDIGTGYTVGEFDRVLDDIENGVRDPMLPLTTAEDVDLDMEDVIQGNLDGEFSDEEDLFD